MAIAYPADAIKFCASSLKVRPFLCRQNAASIEIGNGPIDPKRGSTAELQSSGNARVGRQQTFVSYNMASDAELPKCPNGCPCINAHQIYGDWLIFQKNITTEPKMLQTNLGSVSGIKFVPSKFDLKVGTDAEPDCSNSQNGGEPSEHLRVVRDNLRRNILGAFIFGCVGGCVAWRACGGCADE